MKRYIVIVIGAAMLLGGSPLLAQPGKGRGQCCGQCCRGAGGPRNGTGPRAQTGTCPRMNPQPNTTPAPAPPPTK